MLKNQSVNFYRKCIENKLGTEEFRFKVDGTTHLKLSALPVLMDPYLFVDKVVGGVNFCLGLSKEDELYVPLSALCEDIKKLTDAPSQVLAILEKETLVQHCVNNGELSS